MLVVRESLVFDVVRDNGHVGVADGIGVVTLGPELSSPQFYFEFRVVFEEMIGGDALNHFSPCQRTVCLEWFE